jgi:hypothetical protein
MHGEDRRNQGRRLRALEMLEERALGGRLAGTLYLTGAKATGKNRSLSTRDFALDAEAVA